MRWAEELTAFNFILEYQTGRSNPANNLSRRLDFKKNVVKETLLPTLYNKLKCAEQRALWVAAISCWPIPAKLQFKAQERGGRHSSISKILRDSEEKEDHLSNRVAPESLLLEPITSIASCK